MLRKIEELGMEGTFFDAFHQYAPEFQACLT